MISEATISGEATVVRGSPAAMDEAEWGPPAGDEGAADKTWRSRMAPPERVAAKAYDIWLHKGCPKGCEMENWREAEEELMAELHLSQAVFENAPKE
ncbi:MAG: DUF2934 domain-containing protein [Verrucomicrobia bacterium]|nr:DUF2934 domain-containing protein [Verrucomicrobiota bacterium]